MISWRRITIGYVLALAAFTMSDFAWRYMSPVTFWLDIRSVEFVRREPGALVMETTGAYLRRAGVRWIDRLFCKEAGGIRFELIDVTHDSIPPRDPFPMATRAWRWRGNIPDIEVDCYMESTIAALPGYTLEKPLVRRSKPFHLNQAP